MTVLIEVVHFMHIGRLTFILFIVGNMKTIPVTDRLDIHDNKTKVLCFALNKNLKSGKLDQFKLILRKCTKSESDRKQLLKTVGDVYGCPLLRAIEEEKLDFVKYLVDKCGVV